MFITSFIRYLSLSILPNFLLSLIRLFLHSLSLSLSLSLNLTLILSRVTHFFVREKST